MCLIFIISTLRTAILIICEFPKFGLSVGLYWSLQSWLARFGCHNTVQSFLQYFVQIKILYGLLRLNWLHCFYTLSVVDQSTFCKCFIHSVVHIPVLVCYLKSIIVLWYFREVKHLSVSTSYDFCPLPPLKKKTNVIVPYLHDSNFTWHFTCVKLNVFIA